MTAKTAEERRSTLERLLGAVTEVKAGEAGTALLMTLGVFLLLTSYYVIKPVREALILAMESGADYKSYMGGVIAVALLIAVPAYSRFASRMDKHKLVVRVTLFFVSHLLLFYGATRIPALQNNLGLIFYLWVGIFNMMVVAQFWAFANDIYSEEQGKRLFALIGIGASVGAAVGSQLAKSLAKPLGIPQMLLLSGALLAAVAWLMSVVSKRERSRAAPIESTAEATPEEPKQEKSGAFGMVLRHRYLTLLAAFSLVFTLVNTNGEYMLGRLMKDAAVEAANAAGLAKDQSKEFVKEFLAAEFGEFFLYVNILGVVLQMFVVSRLVKYGGVKLAFMVLPVVALADATLMAIIPGLLVLRIGKTLENATDYSINNTARNMLWLPTTKEMKYKAKQAVDTFFVRMGDLSSAGVVFVASGLLSLPIRAFAIINIVLIVVWLWIGRAIFREQAAMREQKPADA